MKLDNVLSDLRRRFARGDDQVSEKTASVAVLPQFIVLGFFEKLSDAQKFVYSQREEFPLIFTIEVGKWCAFDVELMNNADGSKHVERTQSLEG